MENVFGLGMVYVLNHALVWRLRKLFQLKTPDEIRDQIRLIRFDFEMVFRALINSVPNACEDDYQLTVEPDSYDIGEFLENQQIRIEIKINPSPSPVVEAFWMVLGLENNQLKVINHSAITHPIF